MATAAHPRPDELSAFAQGRLSADESATIEEHLQSCDTCAGSLERQPEDSLLRVARAAGTVTEGATSPPQASTAEPATEVGEALSARAAGAERPGPLPHRAADRPGRHGGGLRGPARRHAANRRPEGHQAPPTSPTHPPSSASAARLAPPRVCTTPTSSPPSTPRAAATRTSSSWSTFRARPSPTC